MRRKAFAVLLGSTICSQSFAWLSVLNFMPTADIIGHRSGVISYTAAGSERNVSKAITQYGSVLVGLWDKVELGYDTDFKGNPVEQFKYNVYTEAKESKVAVSVGFQNISATNKYWEPFVAARYNLSKDGPRLHAAIIRDSVDRLCLGCDFAMGEFTGMLDFASGKGGRTWAGVYTDLKAIPGMNLSVSAGVPHARVDGIQWNVVLSYGFKF